MAMNYANKILHILGKQWIIVLNEGFLQYFSKYQLGMCVCLKHCVEKNGGVRPSSSEMSAVIS